MTPITNINDKMSLVCALVADKFDVQLNALKEKDRSEPLATARLIACYICHVHVGAPYPAIARFLDNRHATAISYAKRKTEDTIEKDKKLAKIVKELCKEYDEANKKRHSDAK